MSVLNTTTHDLLPVQETVLAAIMGGATMKVAAEAAGIHRNTVGYWRQTSLPFRDALCHAQYDKAIFVREEAEKHATEAFAAIHTILTNPDASDTARLNAAKFIIEKASTPPPPKPEIIYQVQSAHPEIVNSPAQSQAPDAAPERSPEHQKPKIVHSPAQSAPPPSHKTGRNEPCPCGSGQKFKRCCIGKPPLTQARAA